MRGALRRAVAFVAALALATPTLALAKAFGPGCGACPASCPMHRTAKLGCHRGTAKAKPACHRTMAGCTLAAPGCAHQGDEDLTGPPAVLVPRRLGSGPMPRAAALAARPASTGRAADPPDTPPPVVVS